MEEVSPLLWSSGWAQPEYISSWFTGGRFDVRNSVKEKTCCKEPSRSQYHTWTAVRFGSSEWIEILDFCYTWYPDIISYYTGGQFTSHISECVLISHPFTYLKQLNVWTVQLLKWHDRHGRVPSATLDLGWFIRVSQSSLSVVVITCEQLPCWLLPWFSLWRGWSA